MSILKECIYSNFLLRGHFFTVIFGIYTIHYEEYCMYLHYSLLVWEPVGKSLKNVLLHSSPCYVTEDIVILLQVRFFQFLRVISYLYLRAIMLSDWELQDTCIFFPFTSFSTILHTCYYFNFLDLQHFWNYWLFTAKK